MSKSRPADRWGFGLFGALFALLFTVISFWTADYYIVKPAVLWSLALGLVLTMAIRGAAQKDLTFNLTVLDPLVGIFLILTIGATIASVHPATSFLGKYLRYEGLLTYLAYAAVFLAAKELNPDGRQLRGLLRFIAGLAGVLAIYGTFQYAGFDFLPWGGGVFAGRGFALFGNPVNFGGFLAFMLPVALALGLYSRSGGEKALWLACAGLVFIGLITTLSRGSWLGGGAGVIAFLIAVRKEIFGDRIRLALAAAITSVVIVLTVFAVPGGVGDSPLKRLADIASPAGSAANRLEIWKSAVYMIKDRPLLGSGPDTFLLQFPGYQTTKYVRDNEPGAIADNAHNYPLELSTTVGVPAALLFFALAMMSIRLGLKSPAANRGKTDPANVYKAALAAGTTGYLVHLLFGISDPAVTAFMWAALGLIVADSGGRREIKFGSVPTAAIAIIVLALSITAAVFSVKIVVGDGHYLKTQAASGLDGAAAVYHLEKALAANDVWPAYHQEGAVLLVDGFQQTRDPYYLTRAIDLLIEAESANPKDIESRLLLANIFVNMSNIEPSFESQAESRLRDVLRLEPKSFQAYTLLGDLELKRRRPKRASAYLTKALTLRPSDETARELLGK